MRIFIVVAKNRPDLYEYFSAGLAGVAGVEVMLDRRFGGDPPAPSEIPSDRRSARNIYEELTMRGFVIVRLPA